MPAHLERLETQLIKLGQQERVLERRIQELLTIAREAGRSGHFDEADAAWALREKLLTALSELQAEIMLMERTLYSIRRRPT